RALEKEPSRRYQSAGEMMQHCQQVFSELNQGGASIGAGGVPKTMIAQSPLAGGFPQQGGPPSGGPAPMGPPPGYGAPQGGYGQAPGGFGPPPAQPGGFGPPPAMPGMPPQQPQGP